VAVVRGELLIEEGCPGRRWRILGAPESLRVSRVSRHTSHCRPEGCAALTVTMSVDAAHPSVASRDVAKHARFASDHAGHGEAARASPTADFLPSVSSWPRSATDGAADANLR
jgi:hypothetical protein